MVSPVQISSFATYSNLSLSASVTLTGVTAGNHIILAVGHFDLGGTSPTVSVSDAQGVYHADVSVTSGGAAFAGLYRLTGANAGSHTITATFSSGTTANSEGAIVAFEVPPVVFDQGNTGIGNSTTPNVSATASLLTNSDLAIAVLCDVSLGSGGTFPAIGGTGPYTAAVNQQNKAEVDYQTLTSTAGAGANWGTLSISGKWAASIGIYAASTPTFVPIAPMALGGMVVQVCQ